MHNRGSLDRRSRTAGVALTDSRQRGKVYRRLSLRKYPLAGWLAQASSLSPVSSSGGSRSLSWMLSVGCYIETALAESGLLSAALILALRGIGNGACTFLVLGRGIHCLAISRPVLVTEVGLSKRATALHLACKSCCHGGSWVKSGFPAGKTIEKTAGQSTRRRDQGSRPLGCLDGLLLSAP